MDSEPHCRSDAGKSFLDLPKKLRLEIFDLVFLSTTVKVERGSIRKPEETEEVDRDPHRPDLQILFQTTATRGLSPLPKTPEIIVSLHLTCRTFNKDITADQWHSRVTYEFPGTVPFVDVLSQWPQSKVESLRHVHVKDTPLPLYPYDDDIAHIVYQFDDVLPMFPGLQLNTLTVLDIWRAPNGEPLEPFHWIGLDGESLGGEPLGDGGFSLPIPNYAVEGLLFSHGWKRLFYRSGILPTTPYQQREFDARISTEREWNFEYQLGRIRPDYRCTGDDAQDDEVEEVKKWYADRPEEGNFKEYPVVEDFQTALWARRGDTANYVQDGKMIEPDIKELLDKVGWIKIRENDRYLVDDGMEDPTKHL